VGSLLALEAVNEEEDIKIYINCSGESRKGRRGKASRMAHTRCMQAIRVSKPIS
jgi:hypothetical protein